MFYRSGWLRCDVFNSIGFVWAFDIWADVDVWYYIIIYYILLLYLILYSSLPLLFSPFLSHLPLPILFSSLTIILLPIYLIPLSSSQAHPLLPSSSDLLSLYNPLIQSIRVGIWISLFMFHQYRFWFRLCFDPACFIGWECRVVQF